MIYFELILSLFLLNILIFSTQWVMLRKSPKRSFRSRKFKYNYWAGNLVFSEWFLSRETMIPFIIGVVLTILIGLIAIFKKVDLTDKEEYPFGHELYPLIAAFFFLFNGWAYLIYCFITKKKMRSIEEKSNSNII